MQDRRSYICRLSRGKEDRSEKQQWEEKVKGKEIKKDKYKGRFKSYWGKKGFLLRQWIRGSRDKVTRLYIRWTRKYGKSR